MKQLSAQEISGLVLLLLAVAANVSPRFVRLKNYKLFAKIGAFLLAVAGALLVFLSE